MTATSVEKHVNGHPVERGFDAVGLAEAEAIRTRAAAEADALRIEAEAKAEAERIKAAEEAEKQRIANEKQRMRLEKDQADHAAYLARKAAEAAKADAEKEKAEQAAKEEAEREAQRQAEQERSEALWKWGARGIYIVGLIIAAPVQFLAFWDEKRPFLVAAPALLEGLALVLACGAAWAVAHRRDVLPYRIGIMAGAAIAATINLWHGLTDPEIGLNAGLIGAIASLGGPIVLMAYEHGIAQKADGIPSFRERRAVARAKAEADAAREKARREKQAADARAAAEKAATQARAEEEQRRRDEDRKASHRDVWDVADAMRAARGSQYVTEQIWAEAWYRVTGCKTVGITPEIEAKSRAAQTRMKAATDVPIIGDFSLVESQKGPRAKKDPDAPDGRRNNGGTPPVRRPGQTAPIHPIARAQARLEQKKD
ncbi:phage-related minor tail protein [Streptomyces glaucescens]